MLTCTTNDGDDAFYLEALNRCFPNWGDTQQFQWCFRRQAGGPVADLMVLSDAKGRIAGSAVTYRTVQLASGRRMLVGIMTGSWTLPEARGQGCFTRIIQESITLTRTHGGALLLAFVTEDNASFRRLREAGSALFPTSYVVSAPEPTQSTAATLDVRPEVWDTTLVERVARLREDARERFGHVVYTPEHWTEQFLKRSNPTELLALGGAGWAVVEHAGAFHRVQATSLEAHSRFREVLAALLARAQQHQRRLFLFSMNAEAASASRELGLHVAPGYLTALAANYEALRDATGSESPWANDDSHALADPSSQWCLGPMAFESGDRM